MTRTIIIGDCHGDARALMAMLQVAGFVNQSGTRIPDTRIIQVGDLIHGGVPRSLPREGVDDRMALTLGEHYCDTILIGNHELPLVWPDAGFPAWNGQRPLPENMRQRFLNMYDSGKFAIAATVGDWLVTHAGVFPAEFGNYTDAESYAAFLRAIFRNRLHYLNATPIIDAIGSARGGRWSYGGVMWCDWSELTTTETAIPQIVGHSPRKDAPLQFGNFWNIDCSAALSGKLAAIVTEDDGLTFERFVVDSITGERIV